jgi:thioredoxin-dependent peroxiredoxin
MAALKEGKTAPNFSLPASGNGKNVKLSDFKGKKNVVLYFYPRDSTPGCTKEACDFRDSRRKLGALNAEVFGISFDSLSSHEKFSAAQKLNFPLLSDESKAVAKKYGVYQKKSLYGRSFMGIVRSTFVIDRNQKIRRIFPKVKVDGHAEEVLQTLKDL